MKIGDIVICIKTLAGTVKGQGYEIISTRIFKGRLGLDLGIKSQKAVDGIHWQLAYRFVKPELVDTESIANEFEEVIESPDKIREIETV